MSSDGSPVNRNGPPRSSSGRVPRRVVLLDDGEESEVKQVLAEYAGAEASGTRLHQDVQRFARAHPGRCVAAEWLGPRGWMRFLWCRK